MTFLYIQSKGIIKNLGKISSLRQRQSNHVLLFRMIERIFQAGDSLQVAP